jgi:hypothetical protein
MSTPLRARGIGRRFVLTVFCLVFAAGCTSTPDYPPPPMEPPPGARSAGLPPGCRTTVAAPDLAAVALAAARPGDVICFTGDRLAGLSLEMTTSGTAGLPIRLIADGAVLRAIEVRADHVVVEGFTLADGAGLDLTGTGVVARNNVVRNAARSGIVCANCTEALLESNTVWRADGTGIVIDGERSEVRNNTVSESVTRARGDADGIRFFGTDLRLTGNTIRDISATGYPEEEAPHTDCFQTFESDSRPTYHVLIAGNLCENVDVQCLIATGTDGRSSRSPGMAPAITFVGNTCAVHGAQAVLLEKFPNVVVRDNVFSGPEYRAVFLFRGSVDCTVADNTIRGDIAPYEIDEASSSGFHAEGNSSG